MSKKSLDEIIAAVEPDAMRKALEQKLQAYQGALAESIATYEIEKANPLLKPDAKKAALVPLEGVIRKWAWAIGEIQDRLNSAQEVLHGGNRAQRRRDRNGKQEAV
jgi:hypothetical protein